MNNPFKTSGLFTENDEYLGKEKIDSIKDQFTQAQNNGSLLWSNIFSFDNEYLKENGVIDEQGRLNEEKIIEATRNSMRKLIEKEGLEPI